MVIRPLPALWLRAVGPGEATSTTYTNVSTLTDAETKVADFALRAKWRKRERERGLRRSRRAAARFRFGSPFSSKRLWFVGLVTLSSQCFSVRVCVCIVAILKVSRLGGGGGGGESQVCVYSHVARYKGVASS